MADFDAQQPVRTTATEFTTEIANSGGTTINPAEDYAQGSTTSGENGVLSMGATTTAAPTYTTGTTNPLSLDTSGNLRVTFAASSEQNVNLTQLNSVALGSPSNYGTSPGAISVQGVNAFITNTVPVTLASTTITGTVTTAGNLTNNNAAPIADNLGVLPALANAAHPTWTEGDQVLLSEDLSGNLRVITGSGSTTVITGTVAVTQSTSPWVSDITQWANTTLGAPSNYGTSPGAVEVIGVNAFITNTVTIAGNLTNNNAAPAATNIGVLPAVAAAAAPTWTSGDQVLLSEDLAGNLRVKDIADGPVTPGTVATNSTLVGGQYNSTPPTLTTGQQVALQVDSAGRLLVDTSPTTVTPVLTYFTDAAVASGATTTHSVAGPVTLDKVDFTSSGEMKGTVAIGTTGSEVTYWNGFNSASNQDFSFILSFPYVIPTGSSVKVTLKNRDTAAQDLYVTFFTH